MKQFYHDCHVHLDLYRNTNDIISHIDKNKSYTIAVTNLPILYEKAVVIFPSSKYVRFALGFHPELVGKFPEQIPKFYEKLVNCRYIGEIGLDFSRDNLEHKELQVEVFKKAIKICNELGGKILSIHSRGSTQEVIDIIGSKFNGHIIMHWFSGDIIQIRKSIENDYYFSINVEMIRTAKGKRIISEIPLNRILIESDGPFTRTVKREYNVHYIEEIVIFLCEIKGIGETEMCNQLKSNFRRILE
ncbi:putative deoxyribonuclease YcfH [compost metagenome]